MNEMITLHAEVLSDFIFLYYQNDSIVLAHEIILDFQVMLTWFPIPDTYVQT